ncbi:MAG: hypothetical protein IPK19_23600 [Chloroflexi bacterium]|nr:hypothetical protein [Chloroflexota bacterium]
MIQPIPIRSADGAVRLSAVPRSTCNGFELENSRAQIAFVDEFTITQAPTYYRYELTGSSVSLTRDKAVMMPQAHGGYWGAFDFTPNVPFNLPANTLATLSIRLFHDAGYKRPFWRSAVTFNCTTGEITSNNTGAIVTTLDGSLHLQGRPPAPDQAWVTPIEIRFVTSDTAETVLDQLIETDEYGQFSLQTGPGDYLLSVRTSTSLPVILPEVLPEGPHNIDFGTLLEGDANADGYITILDFSILAASFSTLSGEPNFNASADFNRDGAV